MSAENIEEFINCIDGEWNWSATKKRFDHINLADTLDIWGRFQASCAADARAAVRSAAKD